MGATKTKCLLNINQMAEILNVPVSWIYDRTYKGQEAIPFIKVGRHLRFEPEVVIEFFKNNDKI